MEVNNWQMMDIMLTHQQLCRQLDDDASRQRGLSVIIY